MTIETNILDEVKKFYDDEYKSIKFCMGHRFIDTDELIDTSIAMCLGVAQFVQYIGASYEEITEIYNEQKARLEELKRRY